MYICIYVYITDIKYTLYIILYIYVLYNNFCIDFCRKVMLRMLWAPL